MATAFQVRSTGFSRNWIPRKKLPKGETTNFWGHFFAAWMISLLIAATSFADEQSQKESERPNPPSDKQRLEKAHQTVVQMFPKDFDQATSPAKKKKLARQLLDNAPRIKEDAEVRYALLVEAKGQAIAAGQIALALEAIDITAKYFRIDSIDSKTAALEELSRTVRESTGQREIAMAALELSKESSADDRFDNAHRLGMLALVSARKSHSMQLIRQAQETLLEINAAKKKAK
jgi:hypothetical protein